MKTLSRLNKKVKKFIQLSWKEKKYITEAFFLTGLFRFAILFIPFNKLASFAGIYNEESFEQINAFENINVKKIGWSISVASKYTPWESKCLVQALTAQSMLKKRNISGTLYLGVAKDKKNNPIAHAWIRSGDIIVTGGSVCNCFTTVAKFANSLRIPLRGGEKHERME